MIMKKLFNKILTFTLVVMGMFLLTSCKKETTITLHTFGDEYFVVEEKVGGEYTLPEISNRKGFIFIGWYDDCCKCGGTLRYVSVCGYLGG